jgi:hypothetical protein
MDSITPEEYMYWMADYSIDPWDETRADLRAAYTTAMVAWTNGNKNTKVEDFMPYSVKPEQSTDDVMTFIGAING